MNKYAKRVDANQSQVVSALKAAGARVWVIGLPVDLLFAIDGRFGFMEVKDGAKPPSARKKTEVQERFFAECAGYPVCLVDGPEAALRHLNVFRAGGI